MRTIGERLQPQSAQFVQRSRRAPRQQRPSPRDRDTAADFVEIGVFPPGSADNLGAPLYLQPHRIRSGKQTIRITVPTAPPRAGTDRFGS
jgi:hypothetical protein